MRTKILATLATVSFIMAAFILFKFMGTGLFWAAVAMLGISGCLAMAAVESCKKRDKITKRVSDIFKEDEE